MELEIHAQTFTTISACFSALQVQVLIFNNCNQFSDQCLCLSMADQKSILFLTEKKTQQIIDRGYKNRPEKVWTFKEISWINGR